MADLNWKVVKEFNEDDISVNVTLADNGIYSYHIGRPTENGTYSRHFGIFINKKTRQIRNRRANIIAKLVQQAEDFIQEEVSKI